MYRSILVLALLFFPSAQAVSGDSPKAIKTVDGVAVIVFDNPISGRVTQEGDRFKFEDHDGLSAVRYLLSQLENSASLRYCNNPDIGGSLSRIVEEPTLYSFEADRRPVCEFLVNVENADFARTVFNSDGRLSLATSDNLIIDSLLSEGETSLDALVRDNDKEIAEEVVEVRTDAAGQSHLLISKHFTAGTYADLRLIQNDTSSNAIPSDDLKLYLRERDISGLEDWFTEHAENSFSICVFSNSIPFLTIQRSQSRVFARAIEKHTNLADSMHINYFYFDPTIYSQEEQSMLISLPDLFLVVKQDGYDTSEYGEICSNLLPENYLKTAWGEIPPETLVSYSVTFEDFESKISPIVSNKLRVVTSAGLDELSSSFGELDQLSILVEGYGSANNTQYLSSSIDDNIVLGALRATELGDVIESMQALEDIQYKVPNSQTFLTFAGPAVLSDHDELLNSNTDDKGKNAYINSRIAVLTYTPSTLFKNKVKFQSYATNLRNALWNGNGSPLAVIASRSDVVTVGQKLEDIFSNFENMRIEQLQNIGKDRVGFVMCELPRMRTTHKPESINSAFLQTVKQLLSDAKKHESVNFVTYLHELEIDDAGDKSYGLFGPEIVGWGVHHSDSVWKEHICNKLSGSSINNIYSICDSDKSNKWEEFRDRRVGIVLPSFLSQRNHCVFDPVEIAKNLVVETSAESIQQVRKGPLLFSWPTTDLTIGSEN